MGSFERGASGYVDVRDVRQRQEQGSRASRMEGLPSADIQCGTPKEVRQEAAAVLRREPRH